MEQVMEASKKKFEELLRLLELSWSDSDGEDGLVLYNIVIDADDDLELTAVMYGDAEEGIFVRLLAYVDELSPDDPLEQLSTLMKLNCELPAGTYCMNPVDNVIYATMNIPLDELDAESLDWGMDFLLDCQSIFFSEFYGDEEGGPDGGAQA
jgi:hypothetical protein